MKLTLLSLLCALLPLSAVRADHTEKIATDGSVDITVRRWQKQVPINGLVQLELEVKNGQGSAGSWTFRTESYGSGYNQGSFNSHLTLSAGPGGTAKGTLFMHCKPVLGNTDSRYIRESRLFTTGPGVRQIPFVLDAVDSSSSSSSNSGNAYQLVAISSAYAASHGQKWKSAFDIAIASGLRKQELPMNSCPTDWRGLTGYSQLWMLGSEWAPLSEIQKRALLGWVAVGGSLYVAGETVSVLDAIQPGKGSTRLLGLGRIVHQAPSPPMVTQGSLLHGSKDLRELSTLALCQSTSSAGQGGVLGFSLLKMTLPAGMIFSFILLFGILVGPVNLFFFAPAQRRPRLFWTTPLISLLGALLLIVIMLVKDGLGGTGVRVLLATVLPEQKQMAVLQHEFSQTGLLFDRNFTVPEQEQVWLLPQSGRPGDKKDDDSGYATGRQAMSYDLKAGVASGDWFRSRSEQTLLMHSLRMSRGTVSVKTSGAQPTLVSSLSTDLAEVYVRDAEGKLWYARQVLTGQRTALTAATPQQLKDWVEKKAVNQAGALVAQRVQTQVAEVEPWFFSLAQQPEKLALPTLGSLRWAEDRAILTGPVALEP
jgi:hypothetical protein